MRYHIISIVTIFLTLGIGILIGNFLSNEGVIMEEQKKLMAALEKDLLSLMTVRDQLKTKITLLEAEKKLNDDFINYTFPLLINGALKTKNVLIIDLTESNNRKVVEGIVDALRVAGVDSVTTGNILEGMDLTKFPERESLIDKLGLNVTYPNDINYHIVDLIVRTLISGRGSENISPLLEAGFISIEDEGSNPVDSVVIIPSNMSEAAGKGYRLDLAIIDALKRLNVEIIGVETVSAKTSYVNEYKAKGISTVDNIDTIPGKLALIHILLGKKGNFGVKGSASSLLPPL